MPWSHHASKELGPSDHLRQSSAHPEPATRRKLEGEEKGSYHTITWMTGAWIGEPFPSWASQRNGRLLWRKLQLVKDRLIQVTLTLEKLRFNLRWNTIGCKFKGFPNPKPYQPVNVAHHIPRNEVARLDPLSGDWLGGADGECPTTWFLMGVL